MIVVFRAHAKPLYALPPLPLGVFTCLTRAPITANLCRINRIALPKAGTEYDTLLVLDVQLGVTLLFAFLTWIGMG